MNPIRSSKSFLAPLALLLALVSKAPASEPGPLAPIVALWREALAEMRAVGASLDRTLGHAEGARAVCVALQRRREAERELNPPIPRHWFRIVGRPYRTVPLARVAD